MNAEDLAAAGLEEGQSVELTSHWRGETRRLDGFRAHAYDLPRGCAAAYFPEANALVPVGAHSPRSGTPAYKSVAVSVRGSAGNSPSFA
jgi:anaerobic selenocysteine-containing dehydrogenase